MNKANLKLLLLTVCAGLLLAACIGTGKKETVLVGGATGRQGGAVVDELLARGYQVRALTRKPESDKAQALTARGVEVVQGNYGDRASLDAAMRDVRNVFFYSGFSTNELNEGLNVIAAAKDAGVQHLIYSSGAAAEPGKGIPGAKMDVERAIVSSGVPYTVFRPVAFMENFAGLKKRIGKLGITDSRAPDRILHFISVRDIGLFVGEAFDKPARWQGKAVNIASDRMTVQQHVDAFSAVLGRPVPYQQLPLDEFLAGMPKPLRPLFRWYDEVGYSADVDTFRKELPQLTTLQDYLQSSGWSPADI
jgi:uncharacterized protein YbjT (DUF2867 family)